MSTKSKAAAAEEKKPITLSSEHVPLSYRIKKDLQRNGMIYAMLIPVLVYYAIFKFGPMFGLYISFIDYKPARGIFGSKFVGLKWFKSFFSDYYFGRLLINTVRIAVADLLTFPLPVILALLINELKNKKFSKTAQTLLYVPHFISTVVICGIVITLTSSTGAITEVLHNFFGIKEQALLNNPSNFLPIYILTELWQTLGWNSIIYLSALSGIDQELYDAAKVDGANRWQQCLHVTLPGIAPTIVIMLISRSARHRHSMWIRRVFFVPPLRKRASGGVTSNRGIAVRLSQNQRPAPVYHRSAAAIHPKMTMAQHVQATAAQLRRFL